MLPTSERSYRTILTLYLQILTITGSPLPVIFQAQPQVIKHTLQGPIPIETLQSFKTQKVKQTFYPFGGPTWLPKLPQSPTQVLQRLAAIQSMQMIPTMNQIQMQSPIATQSFLNQMLMNSLQATNPQMYQEIPVHFNAHHDAIVSYQNQAEEAMQEIALQQQMLALQQLQALTQTSNSNPPFGQYQLQPMLIMLPDDEPEIKPLVKYTNNKDDSVQEGISDENDSVVIENSENETHDQDKPIKVKGMRKAILLVPNARFSIGGIISQIPWLPIEINVPDTAIWAWNGIYDGISSIIAGIGNTWPFNLRPRRNQTAVVTEPSVKAFLKQLQKNGYENVVPVYPLPFEGVLPVNIN